jgi:hypothetical protein
MSNKRPLDSADKLTRKYMKCVSEKNGVTFSADTEKELANTITAKMNELLCGGILANNVKIHCKQSGKFGEVAMSLIDEIDRIKHTISRDGTHTHETINFVFDGMRVVQYISNKNGCSEKTYQTYIDCIPTVEEVMDYSPSVFDFGKSDDFLGLAKDCNMNVYVYVGIILYIFKIIEMKKCQ